MPAAEVQTQGGEVQGLCLEIGTFGLKKGQFFWPERYTGAPVVVAYTKGLVTNYG